LVAFSVCPRNVHESNHFCMIADYVVNYEELIREILAEDGRIRQLEGFLPFGKLYSALTHPRKFAE
jgi:hypothetical protein